MFYILCCANYVVARYGNIFQNPICIILHVFKLVDRNTLFEKGRYVLAFHVHFCQKVPFVLACLSLGCASVEKTQIQTKRMSFLALMHK
jgi:hypothetical protein